MFLINSNYIVQLDLDKHISLVHSNITNKDIQFNYKKLTEDFNILYFINHFESLEFGEEIIDNNIKSADIIYNRNIDILKDCKSFNISIYNNKDRELKINQPVNNDKLYDIFIINK